MNNRDGHRIAELHPSAWTPGSIFGLLFPLLGACLVSLLPSFRHAESMETVAVLWSPVPLLVAYVTGMNIPGASRIVVLPAVLSILSSFLHPWLGYFTGLLLLSILLYRTQIPLRRILFSILLVTASALAHTFALENITDSGLFGDGKVQLLQLYSLLWILLTVMRHHPAVFLTLVRDGRWSRVMFFFLNYLAGWTYVHPEPWWELPSNIFTHMLMLAGIAAVAWHAIVINNLEDMKIDQISNPGRPLVQKVISPETYQKTGWAALYAGILIAASVSLASGFYLLLCGLGYWLYSANPIRLKRIPFISKLMIGFNVWCMWLMGMIPQGIEFMQIPLFVHLYAFAGVGITSNFIDLKDVAGDRADGVRTLPVLFGVPVTLAIVIIATLASYAVLLGEVQGNIWKMLALGNMCLQILGYLHPRTRDRLPFIAMNLGMAGFILSRYFPL